METIKPKDRKKHIIKELEGVSIGKA